MKTKSMSWMGALIFGCSMLLFPGCDSSIEPVGMGDAEFQITDAPSDDASVKGVFITVADIKVDGQSVSGFTRTTVDLKAYREGNVKVLGSTKLNARTYSTLTLVLDTDKDANGATPGCYVLGDGDVKYRLRSGGTVDVVVNKSWSVAANTTSKVVLDVDLRKAVRADADPMIRYQFVSDDNLRASVRMVARENTGTIVGSYAEQNITNADLVVAYAYRKGTYNADLETSAQGDDAIRFKGAVASTIVSSGLDPTFKLAFLEAGDYEIHFASYHQEPATGKFTFQSMLRSNTTVNGSLADIVMVQAGMTILISSQITGTL